MNYQAYRRYYDKQHRTLGCKITHMVGVPLIFLSLIAVFFSWQTALVMFIVGWAFQFAGHIFFERNRPALFVRPSHLSTYYYALVFAAEQWWKLLTGRMSADRQEKE